MWSKSTDWFLYDIGLRHERVKPGDICIDQLLSIPHKIYKSFHENLEVRSIFLNTSKTFNEVWCNSLMYKEKQNSTLGYILNTIIDFLLAPCMSYSFFSVLPDMNALATQMNYELNKLRNWVFQWEMNFNPDFTKLISFIIFLSIC